MDRNEFWHTADDTGLVEEFIKQHTIPITFEATQTLCVICETPIKVYGDAGWRHMVGFHERHGCTRAIPPE
jgi:hypothetical protein